MDSLKVQYRIVSDNASAPKLAPGSISMIEVRVPQYTYISPQGIGIIKLGYTLQLPPGWVAEFKLASYLLADFIGASLREDGELCVIVSNYRTEDEYRSNGFLINSGDLIGHICFVELPHLLIKQIQDPPSNSDKCTPESECVDGDIPGSQGGTPDEAGRLIHSLGKADQNGN